MKLVTDLSHIPILDSPSGLTIGSFDGVHLGHQYLLQHLRNKISPPNPLTVFSFSNHPSHLFSREEKIEMICTPKHKEKLLKEFGVDLLFMIPFTQTFANMSFDHYLTLLHQHLHFTHLVLGVGAAFGKNREGNAKNVEKLSASIGFQVEYIEKFTLDHQPISSRLIRLLISAGDFSQAAKYLGRPYSVYAECKDGVTNCQGLCLPPTGIYPVLIKEKGLHTEAFVDKQKRTIQISSSLQSQELEIVF